MAKDKRQVPNRSFRTKERRSFGPFEQEVLNLPGEVVEVEDLWHEVAIDARWTAAFRMVPYRDSTWVVAEVRVFPADEWPTRTAGRWRAHALGENARALDGHEVVVSDPRPGMGGRGCTARFPKIGSGMGAEVLRRVPFGVLQRLQWWLSRHREQQQPEQKPRPALRPGAWPDSRYAKLAAAYAARVAAGSRSPNQDVARRFHGLTPAQVRDAIHTARTRGILSETAKQGKAGGVLTPYGESLLPKTKRS